MARARATVRHPQGWFYLVEQLAAAPDHGTFLSRMLDLQCKIVAAEYGALWRCSEDGKLSPVCVWPAKVAAANLENNPALRILTEAAEGGFDKQFSHVLRVDQGGIAAPGARGGDGGGTGGAHAFVTILRRKGQVDAVVTAVAHVSDTQVIQSTAAVREVAAGLYDGFESRQDAAEYQRDAQRVRRALALLAVTQEAPGFKGACLNLVNELAQQFSCRRASIGWIDSGGLGIRGRGQVTVVAMSDTENLRRYSELVIRLELAMAECLDQQQPIVVPVPEGAEPLLTQAVLYAHRGVVEPGGSGVGSGSGGGGQVVSIPLRDRDEWLGVLTLQCADQSFDGPAIAQLQLIADVIAPHLADRQRGDRWLIVHTWQSLCDVAGYVIGPRHVAPKLAVLVLMAVVIYALVGSWPYHINAPFEIEARQRQIISSPFEGVIESVEAKEGVAVAAGQVLAKLETHRQVLERAGDVASRQLYRQQLRESRSEGDIVRENQHAKQIEQMDAIIALLDDQIKRATLLSPIGGTILQGKWHDRVGSLIKQGQKMFEIAPIDGSDDLVAVLHVSEQDIDQLRIAMRTGPTQRLRGQMATRSQPHHAFDIEMIRIIPYAAPVDGVNSFQVRCRIVTSGFPGPPGSGLRPGMQGAAKLDAGKKNIAWILTHRIADTLRLWFWY